MTLKHSNKCFLGPCLQHVTNGKNTEFVLAHKVACSLILEAEMSISASLNIPTGYMGGFLKNNYVKIQISASVSFKS